MSARRPVRRVRCTDTETRLAYFYVATIAHVVMGKVIESPVPVLASARKVERTNPLQRLGIVKRATRY